MIHHHLHVVKAGKPVVCRGDTDSPKRAAEWVDLTLVIGDWPYDETWTRVVHDLPFCIYPCYVKGKRYVPLNWED